MSAATYRIAARVKPYYSFYPRPAHGARRDTASVTVALCGADHHAHAPLHLASVHLFGGEQLSSFLCPTLVLRPPPRPQHRDIKLENIFITRDGPAKSVGDHANASSTTSASKRPT